MLFEILNLIEAEWLECNEIYCPESWLLKQAVGSLCLIDGIACEAHCKKIVEEIMEFRKTDMAFDAESVAVRLGVETTPKAESLVFLRKQDFVQSQTSSGFTVSRDGAFVSFALLKKHFGM